MVKLNTFFSQFSQEPNIYSTSQSLPQRSEQVISMALRRASSTFFNKLVHSTTRQSVHNNVAPHRNFSSGTFLISLLSLFYPLFGLRENRRKISFFFLFFSFLLIGISLLRKLRGRIEMKYLAQWKLKMKEMKKF